MESVGFFRELVENSRDIIFLMGIDGTIVYISPSVEEVSGFTPSEMIGHSPFERVHPEDLGLIDNTLKQVLSEGETSSVVEFRYQHKNGKWLTLEGKGKVITAANGIVCITRNITARKEEERLALEKEKGARERERLARLILRELNKAEDIAQTIRDLIQIFQEGSEIEAVAIRLRQGEDFPYFQSSGFPEEFIIHEKTLCCYDEQGAILRNEDKVPVLACMCGHVLTSKKVLDFPFFTPTGSFWTNSTTDLLKGADPTVFPVKTRNCCSRFGYESMALIPLRTQDKVIGLLQLNDHRRDQFSLELVEFFEGLAPSIAIALTRSQEAEEKDILQKQLFQAQKMETIGHLAGGVAHEFNNLLMIILGNTSLIEVDDYDPEDLEDCVQAIKHAAERAANITKGLLGYSRKQVCQPVVLDLNSLIKAFLSAFEPVLSKTVRFEFNLEPNLDKIFADPNQLESCFLNLVTNSIHSMPQGGIIKIKTKNVRLSKHNLPNCLEAYPGNFIKLSVADSGTGIPSQFIPKIFEPFFTTKTSSIGTGLGLSLVHGIVYQHHGFIDVVSTVGKGTTFFLYFPKDKVKRVSDSINTAVHKNFKKSGKILLVDDEIGVRKVMVRFLTRQGYEIVEASDGLEALTILETTKVDLVITDYVMPNMGGELLAEAIADRLPEVKILFISGYPFEAESLGGKDFLSKPIDSRVFIDKVKKLLGQ